MHKKTQVVNGDITRCVVTRPRSNMVLCSDPIFIRPRKVLAQSTTIQPMVKTNFKVREKSMLDSVLLEKDFDILE